MQSEVKIQHKNYTSTQINRVGESQDSRGLSYAIVALYVMTCIGISFPSLGLLRYSAYILPIVFLFFGRLLQTAKPKRSLIDCVVVYLLLSALSLLASGNISEFLLRDFLIITGYFVIFLVAWRPSDRIFDTVLIISFVLLMVKYSLSGKEFGINMLVSGSLIDKYDDVDSFIGLALVLYYLRFKRDWRLILAVAIVFLGGKRIAVGSLLLGSGFLYFSLYVRPAISRSIFIVAMASISFFGSNFVHIVDFAFNTIRQLEGLHIEDFMAGRYFLSSNILRIFEGYDWTRIFFGSGPGAADSLVVGLGTRITLIHNDWLKIMIDYGYFGVVGFLYIYCRMFIYNRWTMALGLMTAIVMVTDNILIYMFYQFPLIMSYWAISENGNAFKHALKSIRAIREGRTRRI